MSEISGSENIARAKYEQIQFYKMAKGIANQLLQENIEAKGSNKATWENRIIENNIVQLCSLIQQINKGRRPESLDYLFRTKNEFGYDKRPLSSIELDFIQVGLMYKISRHSLNYSVVYDMYWNEEGTVGEHIDIALGRKSVKELTRYTPTIITNLTL